MDNQGLFKGSGDFPLIIELNFRKLFDELDRSQPPGYDKIQADSNFDAVRNGIKSQDEIIQNSAQIASLMQFLFPSPLRNNEIKVASIPFTDILFYKSDRFTKILEAAGDDFVLETRNMDSDNAYIFACSLILIFHYGYKIDFKRPFFYDIPTADGHMKNYRIVMNGDFMEIHSTENAIPITDDDVAELIDNFDNVDIWKEKFPPNSYIFKGFGISNMFDLTLDETLSDLKTNLLSREGASFPKIERNLQYLFDHDDLRLGITLYDSSKNLFKAIPDPLVRSIILHEEQESHCDQTICLYLQNALFQEKQIVTISDVEKYGIQSKQNGLFQKLDSQGFKSFLCAPIMSKGKIIATIELASPQKRFLNSINANKLDDIIPVFSMVMEQGLENLKNLLEVIIQEECTSIHPAVAWRFEEEAEIFHREKQKGNTEVEFPEIVFEDVYPLYGQSDIRGSSDARNLAIKNDLLTQLTAAEKVIRKALEKQPLPIYNELIFRLEQFHIGLQEGLAAGTDQQILDFLKSDVYPVFAHLRSTDHKMASSIEDYMSMLDDNLNMVYRERRKYDQSVMQINQHLAHHLDQRAAEAQKMFPHFFERYKTDGVEYNMYIGQSLVKDHSFNSLYLNNLKLWQLTTMCELERQFAKIKPSLETSLEIASLILAYSTPLSIRFRMDEKQFDVDGAYNARYEIVKKRIDKSYIKGSSERLTQPGTLSIVYTQQSERLEYDKYAEYLRALGYITGSIEYHILEDLQGITGLRAMRYYINYETPSEKEPGKNKKHKTVIA